MPLHLGCNASVSGSPVVAFAELRFRQYEKFLKKKAKTQKERRKRRDCLHTVRETKCWLTSRLIKPGTIQHTDSMRAVEMMCVEKDLDV